MGFVWKIYRKIKGINKEQKQVKEYNSYTEALKDCPTQKAYENTELCCMISEKTINYIKYLESKPYTVKASNIFLVNTIQTYLLEYQTEKITVLDFGGACGAHYFETRKFFGNSFKFKWFVIETPEIVNAAKERKLENEELFFVENIEKIDSIIDLVHSSGTLQYVPDWIEYLDRLIEKQAKFVLFNRMMFNEHDRTFFTIQKSRLSDNGPGPMPKKYEDKDIFYPHATISYKKFHKRIFEKKYTLEWYFEENSGSYQINNEKIIGRGLLYKKRE